MDNPSAGVPDEPKPALNIHTERAKVIGVRVTPAEYELIDRQAKQLGLKVVAYLRMLALKDAQERGSR